MTPEDKILMDILEPLTYFHYIVKLMGINLADVGDPLEYYLDHAPKMRMPLTYWVTYFDELPDGPPKSSLPSDIDQVHTESNQDQGQTDIDHSVTTD